MAEISRPKLFSRPPAQVDITGFLNGLVDNSPEVREMREGLAQAYKDLTEKDERLKVLERDIYRLNRQLNEWREVADEMHVQLKIMANTATMAAEQSTAASAMVASGAIASLQAAKERLARSGMAMVEAAAGQTKAGDEGAKKIAEMFKPRDQGDAGKG
jgi:hypothetical protein